MSRNLRIIGVSLALTVDALLGLGCAQLPQLLAHKTEPVQLEARGPGAEFPSIEAAAVDALTYAYLQAQAAHGTELMRGGTIYRVGEGFSYGEILVAGPWGAHRISYTLGPQDVARFTLYPRVNNPDVDLGNERPSPADRRSVSVIDPLHRPLYILHPSLMIREYRGEDHELTEVADLRHPARSVLLAGEN
jgi:hypothetical protein